VECWVGCAVDGECFCDVVVVDDEVGGVGFDVGLFWDVGWSDDEGDSGGAGLPAVVLGSVDACVVAFGAGGSEVGGVVPGSALGDGDDVVDVGGCGGAFGSCDLAGVLVAFEDGFSDAGPGSFVGGVCGWH